MAENQNMRAPEKRSLITMVKPDPTFWFPVYAIGFAYLMAWIVTDIRFLSFQDTKRALCLLLALAALVSPLCPGKASSSAGLPDC